MSTLGLARLRAYGQEDHVRLYGRDLGERLVDMGFQVTMRRYLDELDSSERARYALRDGNGTGMRGADIYVCLAAKEPSTPAGSGAGSKLS